MTNIYRNFMHHKRIRDFSKQLKQNSIRNWNFYK